LIIHLLNREIPLKRKITKGEIHVEREKVIKHHKYAVLDVYMVLEGEHKSTQCVFVFEDGSSIQRRQEGQGWLEGRGAGGHRT